MSAVEGHQRWKVHGPKQGTECECGEIFYPERQSIASIVEAWRYHVYTVTGLWPNEH